MKKLVFAGIIFFVATITLIFLHFNLMKLASKKADFKKEIAECKKRNAELMKRRDVLKKADYETVRGEAINLGFSKKEDTIIKFTKKK